MSDRDPPSRAEQLVRGIFAVLFACVPIIAAVLVYTLVLIP